MGSATNLQAFSIWNSTSLFIQGKSNQDNEIKHIEMPSKVKKKKKKSRSKTKCLRYPAQESPVPVRVITEINNTATLFTLLLLSSCLGNLLQFSSINTAEQSERWGGDGRSSFTVSPSGLSSPRVGKREAEVNSTKLINQG